MQVEGSSMDPKDFADKYWRPLLISMAVLALLVFYKADIFAGAIVKDNVYVPIEITLALLVPAALLYMLMLLIEKNNRK